MLQNLFYSAIGLLTGSLLFCIIGLLSYFGSQNEGLIKIGLFLLTALLIAFISWVALVYRQPIVFFSAGILLFASILILELLGLDRPESAELSIFALLFSAKTSLLTPGVAAMLIVTNLCIRRIGATDTERAMQ